MVLVGIENSVARKESAIGSFVNFKCLQTITTATYVVTINGPKIETGDVQKVASK